MIIVHTTGPFLPAEIWLQVFDELARGGDHDAIQVCAAVCRVFAEWSKQYIGGTTFWSAFTFRNGAEVRRAVEFLPKKDLKVWLLRAHSVSIVGGANTRKIPHKASFASTFAGRWARIGTLFIEKASWPSSL